MAYFEYLLYSAKLNKNYTGKTESQVNRLAYHNSFSNQIWTKRGQPWVMKAAMEFSDSQEASRVERFIKNQKSRVFIEKIISKGWNP